MKKYLELGGKTGNLMLVKVTVWQIVIVLQKLEAEKERREQALVSPNFLVVLYQF